MEKNVLERFESLLLTTLSLNCPVLSGNMKQHISSLVATEHERRVLISAPFYDMGQWKEKKSIAHTGKNINGFTDYAFWVNESGGFGRHNASEGWVNRSILDVANAIASEIGATVVYRLGGK